MIFLDTNIISYCLSPNERIINKLEESITNGESIYITLLNVYEILKGLKWRKNLTKEKFFNGFLKRVQVANIDDVVVSLATEIYADLRRKGKTIGDIDILIAAIVIKNNGILVTNNTKHYEIIESLKIENWL